MPRIHDTFLRPRPATLNGELVTAMVVRPSWFRHPLQSSAIPPECIYDCAAGWVELDGVRLRAGDVLVRHADDRLEALQRPITGMVYGGPPEDVQGMDAAQRAGYLAELGSINGAG